jgi:hypothetical protein
MCKFKVFILFLFVVSVVLASCQKTLIYGSDWFGRNLSKTLNYVGKKVPKEAVLVRSGTFSGWATGLEDDDKLDRMTEQERLNRVMNSYVSKDGVVIAASLLAIRSNLEKSVYWMSRVGDILQSSGWEVVSVKPVGGGAYSKEGYYAVVTLSDGVCNVVFMKEYDFENNLHNIISY